MCIFSWCQSTNLLSCGSKCCTIHTWVYCKISFVTFQMNIKSIYMWNTGTTHSDLPFRNTTITKTTNLGVMIFKSPTLLAFEQRLMIVKTNVPSSTRKNSIHFTSQYLHSWAYLSSGNLTDVGEWHLAVKSCEIIIHGRFLFLTCYETFCVPFTWNCP